MFVIAEVIRGNVYVLDGARRVWRLSGGYDNEPVLELLDSDIGHDQINRLAEPKLIKWLKD
jgi:hypothetical protein